MIPRPIHSLLPFILILLCPFQLSAKPLEPKLYWQDPSIGDVALSPSGKYLATNTRNGETHTVTIIDMSKKDTPVIGVMDGVVMQPSGLTWASDERLLINVYVPYGANRLLKKKDKGKDVNLNEYLGSFRIVSVTPQADNLVVLMEDEFKTRGKRWRRTTPRLSDILPGDAEHVLMSKIIRSKRRGTRGLYKVNIHTGKGEKIAEGGRHTSGFITDRQGELRYRYDIHFRSRLIEIFERKGTGWKQIARLPLEYSEDEENFDPSVLYSIEPNGDLIYRQVNQETGFHGFYKRSIRSGKLSEVYSLKDRDIVGLIKDQFSNLLGYYTESDIRHHHLDDATMQSHYEEMFRQAQQQQLMVDYNSKRRKVVLSTGRDNRGIYFIYDESQKKLRRIGERYPILAEYSHGLPATIRYKTRDNVLIQAYALFPPNFDKSKASPMVLLPHGGPFSRNRGWYDFFAQFIASRGYIVLQPNFRGSTGYGKKFEEAGYKQFGGIMLNDMEDGVDFMIEKGFADAKRVCIAGISYGGYAALMSIAKTPKRYQCAVSINGISDLEDQISHTTGLLKKYYKDKPKEFREISLNNFYRAFGEKGVDTEYFQTHSAINFIDKIQADVLIVTGNMDYIVPSQQGKRMHKALRKAGKKSKYIELHGAFHSLLYWYPNRFVEEDEVIKVYNEIEKILDRNLGKEHS